ncbi:beta subunit of RNA polymerase [Tanacetum coccineum]
MQRQAVPLSQSEKCIVGTGLEGQAALDSGALAIAEHEGKIIYTDTDKILLSGNGDTLSIPLIMGASGGLEAIAIIKAIQTGWLHRTINQINPEPYVEFDTISNRRQKHEINVGISNSFGIGGHNSVVAFSAFEPGYEH